VALWRPAGYGERHGMAAPVRGMVRAAASGAGVGQG